MTQSHGVPAGKLVCVIGAGVSGIMSTAHLLKQGIRVVVFERNSQCGGVWNYQDTPAPEPTWPSTKASVGDYRPTKPGQTSLHSGGGPRLADDELRRAFAPASACWTDLNTNIPTSVITTDLATWPAGTKNLIPHAQVKTYVQGMSVQNRVHDVTEYDTRVEELRKTPDGTKWELRTVTLLAGGELRERIWQCDAVVVATGHNWLPHVPDIEGLAECKRRFPHRFMHSRQYRRPDFARGKTVLVIGCGTSTLNICQEVGEAGAKSVIQGVRGKGELPAHVWPESVRRVPAPVRYEPLSSELPHDGPIPCKMHLEGGEVLEGIDHVIYTTGYLNSVPFLPHLHRDDVPPEQAGPHALVTSEGKLTHNLHKDIFYIEDPSLVFVGVPVDTATFNLFEWQAKTVARVFAGKAELPSKDEMRQEYEKRVAAKGLKKKALHSLKAGGEVEYVKDLVDWCNRDAERLGFEKMEGHSDEWLQHRSKFMAQVIALLMGQPGAKWPGSE